MMLLWKLMSRHICQQAAMAGTSSESWLRGCSQSSALGAGLWWDVTLRGHGHPGYGRVRVRHVQTLVYCFGSPAAIGLFHILTSIMWRVLSATDCFPQPRRQLLIHAILGLRLGDFILSASTPQANSKRCRKADAKKNHPFRAEDVFSVLCSAVCQL